MQDDSILYNSLLSFGALDKESLDEHKESAKLKKTSLYDYLVERDVFTDENIGKAVADYLKTPFVSLSSYTINKDVVKIVPLDFAAKNLILPFDEDDKAVYVATADPSNRLILNNIMKKAGKPVKVYFATRKDISSAMSIYQKELGLSFEDLVKASKDTVESLPVAKIVDLLIVRAYSSKASDIHIEPTSSESLIRFRIDGILHDVLSVPVSLHQQIVSRIKVLSKLRTDEHLNAQDGKLQLVLPEERLDIRVSIVPIVEGEKIVMRLLSSKSRQFGLTDLGMTDADLVKVKKAVAKPWGMILSTGPTGSGKTTTMYALIKIVNSRDKNVAAIEDPIEYQVAGVNQIQVNTKTNLTFASGLRSILRQDPDIIFVGEIRDEETAGIAVNAAMTGHLVLSTLHTNDASTTIPRLYDMKIEPFLISSTVNLVIGQRLIRKICEKCRVSYTQDRGDFEKSLPKELFTKYFPTKELHLYKGKGCSVCHDTGYLGRIGVFEVLEITDTIRELITKKADSSQILAAATKEGLTTLLEAGIIKVQQGVTTLEEVLRVVRD